MGEYVQLPRRKLNWYYGVADFANIFKAFIGTNYLSLAYGFKQSGLGFGVAGLLVIAVLTGHCCRLIIKCKHIVIDDLCRKYELSKEADNDADLSDIAMFRIRLLRRLDYTDIGRLICGRWGGFVVNFCLLVTQVGFCVGYFIFIGNTVHALFPKTWVSMAADGTCVPMDQSRVHFHGNSSELVSSVDAYRQLRTKDDTSELHNSHILSHKRFVRELNSSLLSPNELFDLMKDSSGNISETSSSTNSQIISGNNSTGFSNMLMINTSTVSPIVTTATVKTSTAALGTPATYDTRVGVTALKTDIAPSGSLVATSHARVGTTTIKTDITLPYMPETSDTRVGMTTTMKADIALPTMPEKSDTKVGTTTVKNDITSTGSPETSDDFVLESVNTATEPSSVVTRQQAVTTTTEEAIVTTTEEAIVTTTEEAIATTTPDNATRLSDVIDASRDALCLISSAPPLALLVLSALPLLIVFTFFRTVRQMAIISVGANIAILIGLFSVLFYILSDFHPSPTIIWYRWATLPVFFGQLTGAYEAIGIIIPIESSMEGNQHMFPGCLGGAISIFTGLLGALAVAGYTQYGEDTDQIIAQNLPTDNMVGLLINITLICGVVCTYPLQVFPVVEIVEGLLFADGRSCGPKTGMLDDEFDMSDNEDDAEKTLLKAKEEPQMQLPVAVFVSKSVPAWKRNLLRSVVAIVIALIAVMLRRVFAYVGALVGAIGSSPLVFIMPCLFHFKLRRHQVSPLILAKDVAIIVFGAIAGLLSFIVVVQEIVERV